jgi:hypothetical protein
LNEQWPIPLGDSFAMWYKAKIAAVQKEVEVASDARIIWGVVNGFLLYWDQVCYLLRFREPMTSVFLLRLVFRMLLIPLMLGYSFVCHMMYSRSEDSPFLSLSTSPLLPSFHLIIHLRCTLLRLQVATLDTLEPIIKPEWVKWEMQTVWIVGIVNISEAAVQDT